MKFRLSMLVLVTALVVAAQAKAGEEENSLPVSVKLDRLENVMNKLETITEFQARNFVIQIIDLKIENKPENSFLVARRDALLKRLKNVLPEKSYNTVAEKYGIQEEAESDIPFYKKGMFWMISGGTVIAIAIIGGGAYAILSNTKVEQHSDSAAEQDSDAETPSDENLEQSDV